MELKLKASTFCSNPFHSPSFSPLFFTSTHQQPMSSYRISLDLFIIFFILASLLTPTQSVCLNNGNYTSNSTYSANLNAVLSSLPTNINSTSYYSASVGQNPDRANAIALCRGDTQLHTCRECLRNITADLVKSCPYQKQAVDWYEFCMLRYSNETISFQTRPAVFISNTANVSSPERFAEDLRWLVDSLRNRAASGGSLRKVAAGNTTAPDFQTIYSMMQCTPDLSAEDCSSCLLGAAQDVPNDRTRGARVNRPSCILWYGTLPFYNETRLQELEFVSVPEPPILSPPGNSDGNTTQTEGKNDGNKPRTVIIIVVAIVAFVILAASIGIMLRNRIQQKPKEMLENVDEITTAESLQYAFSTIKAATNDFSDNNKLGQGGFGAVYKGILPYGQEIAVKRLSMNSAQGDLEFKNEILLLAKLQHRNLVRLLGFSIEGTEKLLIYEFVQNGSLDHFIYDPIKRSSLDWDRRYKIIGGIARGILYLHEDSQLRIIHRDLKAANVLVDREMNPKIADFGLARLFEQDETQASTSRIVGTYGFMAPELLCGHISVKSDVYSFGVLVLEIIFGQKNSFSQDGENIEDLKSFAWKNWRGGTPENIVDPVLMRPGSASVSDVFRCIHIGLLCVQENAADRPTMASVVVMLSSVSITLAVPSEPAYFVPSHYGPEVSLLQEHNPRGSGSNPGQSDHDISKNDISITELYPR